MGGERPDYYNITDGASPNLLQYYIGVVLYVDAKFNIRLGGVQIYFCLLIFLNGIIDDNLLKSESEIMLCCHCSCEIKPQTQKIDLSFF